MRARHWIFGAVMGCLLFGAQLELRRHRAVVDQGPGKWPGEGKESGAPAKLLTGNLAGKEETAPHEASPTPTSEGDLQLGPKLQLQSGTLAWEARVAKILEAPDLSDRAKARQLLTLLTALPEEALESTTREAITRLPDADYGQALGAVVNPQTHGMELSVLFGDLLERPDAIALPALLTIARAPSHPFAATAKADLELLLGVNHGSDWSQWEASIRKSQHP